MSAQVNAQNRWTEKVSEAVARAIVQDIVSRDLAPGTMLPPESEMLEHYRVGRASLREALRILEVHGLISIKPGRGGGPVVARVSPVHYGRMSTLYFQAARATFQELMDARLIIETMMAAVAARHRDQTTDEALDRALGLTHEAIDAVDAPAYLDAASEFHAIILTLSGNRVLSLIGTALKDIFAERVGTALFPQDYRRTIAEQHDAIASAIREGDAERAEELMRSHMIEYRAALSQRMPGLMDEIVDWR